MSRGTRNYLSYFLVASIRTGTGIRKLTNGCVFIDEYAPGLRWLSNQRIICVRI